MCVLACVCRGGQRRRRSFWLCELGTPRRTVITAEALKWWNSLVSIINGLCCTHTIYIPIITLIHTSYLHTRLLKGLQSSGSITLKCKKNPVSEMRAGVVLRWYFLKLQTKQLLLPVATSRELNISQSTILIFCHNPFSHSRCVR